MRPGSIPDCPASIYESDVPKNVQCRNLAVSIRDLTSRRARHQTRAADADDQIVSLERRISEARTLLKTLTDEILSRIPSEFISAPERERTNREIIRQLRRFGVVLTLAEAIDNARRIGALERAANDLRQVISSYESNKNFQEGLVDQAEREIDDLDEQLRCPLDIYDHIGCEDNVLNFFVFPSRGKRRRK